MELLVKSFMKAAFMKRLENSFEGESEVLQRFILLLLEKASYKHRGEGQGKHKQENYF